MEVAFQTMVEVCAGFPIPGWWSTAMRKWIEMRISDNEVLRQLPADLGRELYSPAMLAILRASQPDLVGGVRRIDLPADSPVWQQVLDICTRVYGDPNPRCGVWPHFRYAKRELAEAEVLRLRITRAFEPEGERCGTLYDESPACPHCGAGRVLVSDLHLKLTHEWQAWPSLPRTKHFQIARTIADEIIVSRVLAERMEAEGSTGFALLPVYGSGPRGEETPHWKQLMVAGRAGRTVPPTEFGIDPFDRDAEGTFRCPMGHVSGLNLLSEVYVPRADWVGSDLTVTDDLVGARRGVLVPSPMLLISQRFYRLLLETGTRGFGVDVAHLV
jgi:hypothetical protein